MSEFNLYWFMLDVSNYQLITSKILIPSDIKDTKDVFLSETPIPGLNYSPVFYGGGGNRKISFTLPLINRNGNVGNLLVLKQFESLRNQATGFTKIFQMQGMPTPNPKVLFQWGINSTPQLYWVKKCDFTHKEGFVNRAGFSQYTLIDFELWMDEANLMYTMEETYRKISAMAAQGMSAVNQYVLKQKPI